MHASRRSLARLLFWPLLATSCTTMNAGVVAAPPASNAADPTTEAAPEPEAQPSPEPLSEPTPQPDAEPQPQPSPPAEPPPTLTDLGPFYEAEVSRGWLRLAVPADPAEWERLRDVSSEPLWAGNRAFPLSLQTFPRIYVIWRDGVKEFDTYARAGVGDSGWNIEYRPRGVRGPVLAVGTAPPAGTTLRQAPKVRRIKRSNPFATRLPELVAAAGKEMPTGKLRTFEWQETLGNFGEADRVIAVSAWGPPPPDDSVGPEIAVVFTANAEGEQVDVVYVEEGAVRVESVVDVDGDGTDEFVTSTRGYEYGSTDLFRLGDGGVERVNLWEHSE